MSIKVTFRVCALLVAVGLALIGHGWHLQNSGIFIKPARAWSHGSAVPAPAAAVGFNVNTFVDNFGSLSTVDTTLSGAPGFSWYLKNAWPQAVSGTAGWTGITTAADTDPATLSITGGALTKSTALANVNQGLKTAQANGSTYRGSVFSGGFYIEVRFKFDPALTNAGAAWPIFWFASIEFLTQNQALTTELDLFEYLNAFGNITDFAVHDWNCGVNPCTQTANNNGPASPGITDANFHTIATLMQTSAQGGGTGSVKRYLDGVLLPANTVTWTSGGLFSGLDTQHFVLIMDSGISWPITVDYVTIWQPSAAGITVQ